MAKPEFSVCSDLFSKAELAGVSLMAAAESLGSKDFTLSAFVGHEKAYLFPIDKSILVVHVMQDILRLAERESLCKS